MFERPSRGDQAVLVHVDFSTRSASEEIEEFRELVISADAEPVAMVTSRRQAPDPRLYIGSGKVEEIKFLVEENNASVVLFNHELSPAQERNLERELQCRVLDRTGLILDIFAQRASSFEGKLQVELAQLRHLSTRLVRGWTHLERQKGGIGLRGPGEKQLETDRRLLGHRIKQINERLSKVNRQRQVQRKSRRKAELPVISLVGYTNAGKSTLFNRLTDAEVLAEDMLFATLDPTMRRLELGGGRAAVIADTVGFIRHLPHELVAAFQATLEETREADLLLHVIDASDPESMEKIRQVNEVLAEIGAEAVPQIQVFNKIDCLEGCEAEIQQDDEDRAARVWCSAVSGAGMELLNDAIKTRLWENHIKKQMVIPMHRADLRARLFEMGVVEGESVNDDGWILTVAMAADQLQRFEQVATEPEGS